MSRVYINRLFLVIVFGLFFIFFSAFVVSAQSLGGVSLSSIPENPEPFEQVDVTLNQYGVDLFDSTIRWYVNDEEQTEYRNARTLSFIAGDLGEQSVVSVVASRPDSPALTISKVFSPTLVDMIIESDTYIPLFYKGRALPSKEADIRVIAVLNGVSGNPFDYTYKWTLGTQVLFGGPIKGKNVAELQMSRFSNVRLRVEVYGSDGERVAENAQTLEFQEPELYFYEESPLRGLIGKAIDGELFLASESTSISAEPYFINTPIRSEKTLYEWEINGRDTYPDYKTPNKLPIVKPDESGSSWISLEIITTKGIPQFVKNTFRLLFE